MTMGKLFDKLLNRKKERHPRCAALVPAAGRSERMGGTDKLTAPLCGVPVLLRTLRALDEAALIDEIVVAVSPERLEEIAALCAGANVKTPLRVVEGGGSRTQSVLLAALAAGDSCELLAVHDGARPLILPEQVDDMVRLGQRTYAAAPALPVTDTVKVADMAGLVQSTPDRKTLYAVQTPQVFQANILKAALQSAIQVGADITDDCSAVERLGKEVWRLAGEHQDHHAGGPDHGRGIPAGEGEQSMTDLRIGYGYDVHRLVPGRALVLGGVTVPFEKGLLGHSDADVLTHAVMDALLGAAALGDIGKLFPDSDARYAGADSTALLRQVTAVLAEAGWAVVNVDATVAAQAPKLAPYIPEMRERLAAAMGLDAGRVSVKATTEEGLGFTGSGEGIAAHAAALVEKTA